MCYVVKVQMTSSFIAMSGMMIEKREKDTTSVCDAIKATQKLV